MYCENNTYILLVQQSVAVEFACGIGDNPLTVTWLAAPSQASSQNKQVGFCCNSLRKMYYKVSKLPSI